MLAGVGLKVIVGLLGASPVVLIDKWLAWKSIVPSEVDAVPRVRK